MGPFTFLIRYRFMLYVSRITRSKVSGSDGLQCRPVRATARLHCVDRFEDKEKVRQVLLGELLVQHFSLA